MQRDWSVLGCCKRIELVDKRRKSKEETAFLLHWKQSSSASLYVYTSWFLQAVSYSHRLLSLSLFLSPNSPLHDLQRLGVNLLYLGDLEMSSPTRHEWRKYASTKLQEMGNTSRLKHEVVGLPSCVGRKNKLWISFTWCHTSSFFFALRFILSKSVELPCHAAPEKIFEECS